MAEIDKKREEIDRDIEFVVRAAYYAGKTGEFITVTVDKCKLHLKEKLHSQGVVIEVDRELPEAVIRDYPPANIVEIRKGYKNAGYVAVEPLIGDKSAEIRI